MSILACLAPEVGHTCPDAAEPVVGGDVMVPLVTDKDRPMERGPETGGPMERAHGLQVGCDWTGVEGHVQGQMDGMGCCLLHNIISMEFHSMAGYPRGHRKKPTRMGRVLVFNRERQIQKNKY